MRALRVFLIASVALLLISIGGLISHREQAIIIKSKAITSIPILSIIEGSMLIDVGDRLDMRLLSDPVESKKLTLEYVDKIMTNTKWDDRIVLKIYPLSRIIKFTLASADSTASAKIVDDLMTSCLQYRTHQTPRGYVLLRKLEPIREKLEQNITEPNKAPEPTPTVVTPRACARVAPSAGLAHL